MSKAKAEELVQRGLVPVKWVVAEVHCKRQRVLHTPVPTVTLPQSGHRQTASRFPCAVCCGDEREVQAGG